MGDVEGTTIAIRDAKSGLSAVVDRVEHGHERILITRHGRPAAVLMSVEDIATMEETLDILSHREEAIAIWAGIDDDARGAAEALTEDEARQRWTARG